MRISKPLRDAGERGFATLEYVVAAAFGLYFFAVLANLIVMQYAGGVVRAALDEGARQAAVAGAGVDTCYAASDEVLDGLLGGEYGEGVTVDCADEGGWIRASAVAVFPGFVPPVPDLTFEFEATVAREDR